MEFPLAAGAYRYRPLKKGVEGWDVFSLQTGLAGTPGFDNLAIDGVFGKQTDEAVRRFQGERSLEVDGIAGIGTQTKLCRVLARQFRKGWQLPNGIPLGHVEAESGFQVGNHTAPYSNGSRDVGIVQRNSQYAPIERGFDAPESLMVLCGQIRTQWERYESWGVAKARALELACGSWNAPAWTDRLAWGDSLPDEHRASIEAYIDRVTKYVDFSVL